MLPEVTEHTVADLHEAIAIYARESRAPFQQLRQGLREIVRAIHADAPALERELQEIQVRLGTPAERPDDLDRATAVGHTLTNMMCLAVLLRGVAGQNPAPPQTSP